MPPLAQLVFLTPRAALVGLAFVAPSSRSRSASGPHSRARSNARLCGSRASRVGSHGLAGLVALAALVAATAAQPAVRDTDSTPVRSDAELYLTFDVSRSMLAASAPGGVARLERARALGQGCPRGARRRSDRRRDAHEPDDAAPLPDRRRARSSSAVHRPLAADHAAPAGSPHGGAGELAGGAGARRRPQLLQPERPEARPRRLQRPRQRLLQPHGDAAAAAAAPDRAVRRPRRGARASGSSTAPAARTPTPR